MILSKGQNWGAKGIAEFYTNPKVIIIIHKFSHDVEKCPEIGVIKNEG